MSKLCKDMEIGELSGRQDILYGPNAMIEQTRFVPETSIEDICKIYTYLDHFHYILQSGCEKSFNQNNKKCF